MCVIAASPMGNIPTALRGNRLYWLAFAVLGCAFAAPVWFSTALPSQDLPSHMAIGETLAHRGADWSEHFQSRLGLQPYHLLYVLLWAGGKVIGAAATMRLLLIAVTFATPATLAYLGNAIGRDLRWASLLGFLFVFGDVYLVGFAPFLLCLPLILAGAAVAVRLVRSRERAFARAVVLAVLAFATVLMHPFGFFVLVIFVTALVLAYSESARQLVYVAAAFAPALVETALFLAGRPEGHGRTELAAGFKLDYLARTPVFLLDAMCDRAHLYVAALLALALVGWAGYRWVRVRPRSPLRLTRRSPLWLMLALVAVYWELPFRAGNTIWLDLRLTSFVWLAFILLVGAQLVADRLGRLLVVSLCLVSAGGSNLLHHRFDAEIAPLFSVIEEMPPNARVLPIARDLSSDVVEPLYAREHVIQYYSPYTHFASYYHLAKGGSGPYLVFDRSLPWIPLVIRGDANRQFGVATAFMPRWTLAALPELAPQFDCVLARGLSDAEQMLVARLFEPVTTAGPFSLFSRAGTVSR